MKLYNQIVEFLNEHNVEFKQIHHEKTPTSEESAKARGEPLKIGAKALLMKGKEFIIAILPADKQLDSKKLRKLLGSKKLRFSTPEEFEELTGLEKGALPPFGNLMQIPMIVDKSLFEEEFMAFNAGSLTDSIKIKTADYKRIVNTKIGEFTKD
jgi:Ala-tRNA(Pro) deacylase